MGRGKRYMEAAKLVEKGRLYSLQEAIELLKGMRRANFDETVELSLKLGVDPKRPDQQVRGTVAFPQGLGKERKVLVFAKGEKIKEAEAAGADFVGSEDLVKKVSEGWIDFDACIATPDMMKEVGKLGRILGPRGLMPNPKSGTITFELQKAIKEIKAGRYEFRVDRDGNLHLPLGRCSFGSEELLKNIKALMEAVVKAKPPTLKGQYLRRATLSSTMGPGVRLRAPQLLELSRGENA